MNAWNRFVEPVVTSRPPLLFDFSLTGALAAIALWVALHLALALSWLSAGQW